MNDGIHVLIGSLNDSIFETFFLSMRVATHTQFPLLFHPFGKYRHSPRGETGDKSGCIPFPPPASFLCVRSSWRFRRPGSHIFYDKKSRKHLNLKTAHCIPMAKQDSFVFVLVEKRKPSNADLRLIFRRCVGNRPRRKYIEKCGCMLEGGGDGGG